MFFAKTLSNFSYLSEHIYLPKTIARGLEGGVCLKGLLSAAPIITVSHYMKRIAYVK